jgi:hypothetical protein
MPSSGSIPELSHVAKLKTEMAAKICGAPVEAGIWQSNAL